MTNKTASKSTEKSTSKTSSEAVSNSLRVISYVPLWKKLVDAKLNKSELAEKAGIGRGTITRMGKNEPVGLDVILKICNYLDCGIGDVVEILPKQ